VPLAGTDRVAPAFELSVQGQKQNIGITQLIQRVEYESADGMADAAKITAINPGFILSKKKAFQPGNEMQLAFGYGTNLVHVGAFLVVEQTPNYPQDGIPTITVKGFTRDTQMMKNAPEKSKGEKGKHGRLFKEMKYSEAVKHVAETYGWAADVDDTPQAETDFIQKVGVTDYQFVRGLANITGFYFWVDGDANGKWTLHFKALENLAQEKIYTFRYNVGDSSSLLSFKPTLLVDGATTKLRVVVKDPKSGKLMETEIEEENESPDADATNAATEDINEEHVAGSAVKVYIKDFAFNITADRKLKTEEEIKLWAAEWFRRQRENFILGRGKTIGLETLMARQVHNVVGLEGHIDGEYYFSRVKHVFDNQQGYLCDFNARKVVPRIA
jgi:phage protein D